MTTAAHKTITVPPSLKHSTLPERRDRLEDVKDGHKKYEILLQHFETLGPIAVNEDSKETRELDDDEKLYLSRECLIRFLIAVKGDVEAAKLRLTKHLVWRRTFNVYDVATVAEQVKEEVPSGKQFSIGYSLKSQPLFYLIPSKVDTKPSITQVQFVVFMAERSIDLMPAGVENLLFCVDLSGKVKTQSGAMSVSRQVLSILQTQYVERLGVAAILSMPWLGSLFLTLLWPFIDPVTKTKIKTNVNLADEGIVAPEMLLKQYGGQMEFAYEPDTYFNDLVKKCIEIRAANAERWQSLGGRIGLSEWDFRMPMGEAV